MTENASVQVSLLDISIPKERINQFLDDLHFLERVANQFGEDCSSLFGEIALLYQIQSEEDLKDVSKAMLRAHCVAILGNLSVTLQEIDRLRATYKEDEDFLLKGTDYPYIFLLLRTLRASYLSLVDLIYEQRYLNPDFIVAIHERLAFLLSPEFEALRQRFHVVESIQNIQKEIKNTVH